MASARTLGITIGADGRRFIDKRYRGIRIGMRLGPVAQEQAEQRLQTEIQRVDVELVQRAHPRPLFRDCAAHYLAQSRDKRSLEAIRVHVRFTDDAHWDPRVHDLRHTFACRLRAAGVPVEDRAALLGHATHSMAGHYAWGA